MIGIVCMLFSLGCGAICGIKNLIDYEESKRRTYDPKDDTFIDNRGYIHDCKSGKVVFIGRSKSSDRLLTDPLTHYTRNLDQEERDKKYRELLVNNPRGVTVALYHRDYECGSGRSKAMEEGKPAGEWYRDLLSDRFLVCRDFYVTKDGIKCWDKSKDKYTDLTVFMYIDNGHIARVVDDYYDKSYHKSKEEVEELIRKFNDHQVELMNDFKTNENKMRRFDKESFYNHKYYLNYNIGYICFD